MSFPELLVVVFVQAESWEAFQFCEVRELLGVYLLVE
jgi:hypothetical protein